MSAQRAAPMEGKRTKPSMTSEMATPPAETKKIVAGQYATVFMYTTPYSIGPNIRELHAHATQSFALLQYTITSGDREAGRTHHSMCSTLSAPNKRPISVSPRREYSASITLWTAGAKPTPNAPNMSLKRMKSCEGLARPMPRYEIREKKSETRARFRSNAGERTSFFVAAVVGAATDPGALSALAPTRGVVSVGARGTIDNHGLGLEELDGDCLWS